MFFFQKKVKKNQKKCKKSDIRCWHFLVVSIYSLSPSQHSGAVLWQIREGNNWLNNFFSVFTIKTQPANFSSWSSIVNQFSKYSAGFELIYEDHYPSGYWNNHGEFDPGSERTLAARLKHASRAVSCSLLQPRAADWWVTRGWRTLWTGIACGNTG